MNDMSQVIIPKSDQVSADDFISGPRTYSIEGVEIRPGTEQPVSIWLGGESRAWKPCKSMSRVLVAAWGPDAKAYVGRSVTLYRDPSVKWGGMEVGGIRVSHLSNIERDMVMALTATKGKRAPYTVKVLKAAAQQQQPTSETTIDDARAAIENAADLGDLKRVWLMKIMAPFRDELKAEMEERKTALSAFESSSADHDTNTGEINANPATPEGRDDADMGEGA